MKKLALVVGILGLSSTALAQTTGTVTITGSVSKVASVRWQSSSVIGSGTGSNATAANTALLFTLGMGDVAANPSNNGIWQGGMVQLVLRANAAYNLAVQATDPDTFASNIKFGLSTLARNGTATALGTLTGSAINSTYNGDPTTGGVCAIDSDGVPGGATCKSLANVTSSTNVVTGSQGPSLGGNLGSPNNGLLVNTYYAVYPQLFPALPAFSSVVTYTITTP